MSVKERLLAIKLIEHKKKNPALFDSIKVEVDVKKKKRMG